MLLGEAACYAGKPAGWLSEVRRDIANRASIVEGRAAPIQIHAQVLRQQEKCAPGALSGFAMMCEDAVLSAQGEPRGKGAWRQSDVKRAIAAAEKAGLSCYRVEIAPDGTISIVVGAPSETAPPGSRT